MLWWMSSSGKHAFSEGPIEEPVTQQENGENSIRGTSESILLSSYEGYLKQKYITINLE